MCAMQSSGNTEFLKTIPAQASHLHRKLATDDKEYENSRALTDKCTANDLDKDPSNNDLFQEPV